MQSVYINTYYFLLYPVKKLENATIQKSILHLPKEGKRYTLIQLFEFPFLPFILTTSIYLFLFLIFAFFFLTSFALPFIIFYAVLFSFYFLPEIQPNIKRFTAFLIIFSFLLLVFSPFFVEVFIGIALGFILHLIIGPFLLLFFFKNGWMEIFLIKEKKGVFLFAF